MSERPRPSYLHHISAIEENDSRNEEKLQTYCQIGNYLFNIYAIDDVIAEAEADIMNYKKPGGISAVCYLEILWEKALRCKRVRWVKAQECVPKKTKVLDQLLYDELLGYQQGFDTTELCTLFYITIQVIGMLQ